MESRSLSRPARSATDGHCLLVIVALCLLVFWPGFWADWGRDDYMQLAMARLVDSPWAFFTTDHFPLPNSVFRPMGFASFWLGQALAGTNFQGHALISFALFASTALLLFALLRRFDVGALAALLATAVFAVHPVAIGTALWWSARFDVLALLFTLIALHQAQRTVLNGRSRHLIATLLALLAAALSKEIGLIAAAACVVLFQHRAWTQRGSFWRAQWASLLCALMVGLFLGWRAAVLGTGGSGIVGSAGLWTSLSEGLMRWFSLAPAYIGFQPQLAWPAGLLALLVACLVLALLPIGRPPPGQMRAHLPLLLIGLCLLLLPALLQAPVVRLNALTLTREMSSVEAAMQSRLFFMSVAGLVLLLALVLDRVIASGAAPRQLAALIGACASIALLAGGSHQQARDFSELSRANAELARQALRIAADFDWPSDAPCHLVIDGAEPPPEWSIYVSMDSVIKALYPDLDAIDHCFVHANYPTFYHLISSEHGDAEASPFTAPDYDGSPLARRRVDGLTLVYLVGEDSLDDQARSELPRRSLRDTDPEP
jgi:hypothetical protein